MLDNMACSSISFLTCTSFKIYEYRLIIKYLNTDNSGTHMHVMVSLTLSSTLSFTSVNLFRDTVTATHTRMDNFEKLQKVDLFRCFCAFYNPILLFSVHVIFCFSWHRPALSKSSHYIQYM